MKLKKLIIYVVSIILVGGIVFIYLVGNFVFNSSLNLVSNSETKIDRVNQLKQMGIDYNEFNSKYNVEEIEINSSLDGHIIPADYITKDSNKNMVVLVHGLGSNRLSTYPVAQVFLRNGYNVIAYDQRSSGNNYAKYNTFGVLESKDLSDYVEYAKSKIDSDGKLGIWGVSFGGATVGVYLEDEKANDTIDFAVLDSPLGSMKYMIETGVNELGLSLPANFMTFCGNIVTKIRLGFWYDDAEVADKIKNTNVPVLVINSKADTLTPYFMGRGIYDAILEENKSILTVEDSEHASILGSYPNEYENSIKQIIS